MAFGNSTATTTTLSTGVNNIDALLRGTQWQSNTVTFSFTSSFFYDYESGYPNSSNHSSRFQSLNATQRAVARDWFAMYEDVSNLNMVELTGVNDRNATMRIAESNDPSTAYGYYPAGTVQAGDIWFNPDDYNSPTIGNYAFHTFGHEIGHALGLKHAHEDGGVSNVSMDANRDSMEFSIMTYRSYVGAPTDYYRNEIWGYAQSLMMYDIAAIQQMYGANFNTNSSNTTYSFSTTTGEMFVNGFGQGTPGGNRIFRTVWDGNGIDTYNFSNYTTNLEIDLTPGGWSNLDADGNFQKANLGDGNYARGHVFNALQYNGDSRSLIENAIGGSGNDSILGNNTANVLNGGLGNDTIDGGYGLDVMDGGAGIDTLDVTFWNGAYELNMSTGITNFSGETAINFENVNTGAGNDEIIGNSSNNTIKTGSGNDLLNGNSGNDLLYGEGGNDDLIGNFGNDTIYGGDGNDTLTGSNPDVFDSGNGEYDILTGGSGADIFVLGDAYEAYYQDSGYATITDFDWYEGDQIQVFGSASNYSLQEDTFNGGIDILYQGDLIGYVSNTTDVVISDDFIFV